MPGNDQKKKKKPPQKTKQNKNPATITDYWYQTGRIADVLQG